MKKLASFFGTLLGALVLFVLAARLFGFNPGATRPGLWLTGELVTEPVTDWSFAANIPITRTAIETRQWFLPFLAHSVTVGRFHHEGRLYFASGYPSGIKLPDGRHWNRNVLANPDVRIRVGDKLYDVTFEYVPDDQEKEDLLRAIGPMFWSPGFYLHVWRVDPRT